MTAPDELGVGDVVTVHVTGRLVAMPDDSEWATVVYDDPGGDTIPLSVRHTSAQVGFQAPNARHVWLAEGRREVIEALRELARNSGPVQASSVGAAIGAAADLVEARFGREAAGNGPETAVGPRTAPDGHSGMPGPHSGPQGAGESPEASPAPSAQPVEPRNPANPYPSEGPGVPTAQIRDADPWAPVGALIDVRDDPPPSSPRGWVIATCRGLGPDGKPCRWQRRARDENVQRWAAGHVAHHAQVRPARLAPHVAERDRALAAQIPHGRVQVEETQPDVAAEVARRIAAARVAEDSEPREVKDHGFGAIHPEDDHEPVNVELRKLAQRIGEHDPANDARQQAVIDAAKAWRDWLESKLVMWLDRGDIEDQLVQAIDHYTNPGGTDDDH